jgi:hypothetical protein
MNRVLAGAVSIGVLIGVLGIPRSTGAVAAQHDVSVSDVNAAAAKLTAALERYLELNDDAVPTNQGEWEAFFDRGDARIAKVSTAFKRWKGLLETVRSEGQDVPRKLARFARALKVWIDDQVEQSGLSRDCYLSSAGFASEDDARTCYVGMLSANGARWQKHTAALRAYLPGGRS